MGSYSVPHLYQGFYGLPAVKENIRVKCDGASLEEDDHSRSSERKVSELVALIYNLALVDGEVYATDKSGAYWYVQDRSKDRRIYWEYRARVLTEHVNIFSQGNGVHCVVCPFDPFYGPQSPWHRGVESLKKVKEWENVINKKMPMV